MKRSTKEVNRDKAEKIADKFEAAFRMKLTEAQARKVLADIYQEIRGETLIEENCTRFFSRWLASKKMTTSKGTYDRYENAIQKLLDFLGDRADEDIAYVTKQTIEALRDATATRLAPSTANTDLKIQRIAMRQAVADGLRLDDPTAGVKLLPVKREKVRRPFTDSELQALLRVANGEWTGMILMGLYTGQRLGDVATSRWSMIDVKERSIALITGKTHRPVRVPLAQPLWDYLAKQDTHKPDAHIFPEAALKHSDSDDESRRLSAEFRTLLEAADLVKARTKLNTGRGHSVRRQTSPLSYHCLRHTATSWLKAAGVPEFVVRDIVGHDTVEASGLYTHADDESKRRAVTKLPDITRQRKRR